MFAVGLTNIDFSKLITLIFSLCIGLIWVKYCYICYKFVSKESNSSKETSKERKMWEHIF